MYKYIHISNVTFPEPGALHFRKYVACLFAIVNDGN